MIKENDIEKALSVITAHEIFLSSPKACRLLEYIVEQSCNNPEPVINEIMIAQDVFGKDADFNPSQDSQVRVAMGRLRNMLTLYYAQTENPGIIISIPTGRYVAKFEGPVLTLNQPENSLTGVFAGRMRGIAFLLVGLFVFGLGFVLSKSDLVSKAETTTDHAQNAASKPSEISGYPKIAVPLFEVNLNEDKYGFLEKALQWKLVEDLSRFEIVRPKAFDGRSEQALTAPASDYDYIIVPTVLEIEPELDLKVKLIEVDSGMTLYENRVQRAVGSGDYFDGLTEILEIIGGEFFVNLSEQRLTALKDHTYQDLSDTENLAAFECLALARAVPNSRNPARYKRAYNCLSTLIEGSPDNSSLMAYLGILKMVGANSNESYYEARSVDPDIDSDAGLELIKRAYEISPDSSLTNYLLAEGYKFEGNLEASRKHAELAYIANPGSPDIIMSLSARLASEGEYERAVTLAKIGAERDPNLNRYLYRIIYLRALMENDHVMLLEQVAQMHKIKDGYAYLYDFVAAVEMGNPETINRLRPEVSATAAKPGNKDRIVKFMSMNGNADTQNRIRDIFIESGIIRHQEALKRQ